MLTNEQKIQLDEIVLRVYPKECVCILTNDDLLLELENNSDKPEKKFKIDPKIFIQYKPKALFHSHTHSLENPPNLDYDLRTPSYADMKNQIKTNIPWGIVSTEGECVSKVLYFPQDRNTDLIGRQFIFYVNDCWTLIRDWYWQNLGVELKAYPDVDWFNDGAGVEDDVYMKQAEVMDFYPVSLDDIQEGDIITMTTNRKNDHGGVYLGDGTILHHFTHRLSGVWPATKLRSFITGALRYKNGVNK